jgi:ABC-type multidrug transport system fused ATPase/permease subunit
MIVAMGLVNMAGVASVLPFLAVLSDPGLVDRQPLLQAVYDALGFTAVQPFLVFLAAATFAVLLATQVVKAATNYTLIRFSKMRNFTLSRRLLAGYLDQPYVWFLDRHSADLGKTILSEVTEVVNCGLIPALQIIAQGTLILGLVAVLILVDPVIAVAGAVCIGGAFLLIFTRARRYLSRIGRDRMAANRARYQIAQEAMGGIKDVKLLALEEVYLDRFTAPARRFSRAQAAAALVGQMPRYLLETIAFGGMLILVLVLLVRNDGSLGAILQLLGVYALTAMRLFPAVQQLYQAITKLRFAGPALVALHADLAAAEGGSTRRGAAGPRIVPRRRIALENVVFTFPNAERPALTHLDLTIETNTTVGLVGPTGAGKTTAVDVLLGLLEPEAGRLLVDETPIDASNRRAWRRSLGYVPQHIFLTDDSVAANIALGVPAAAIDMAAVERAARLAEMHRFVVGELPDGYATRVGERGVRLSGGQRQRIGIARALYHDPDVLVLDEATSALDNRTERAVMDAVHNLARVKTIVMIAHRLSTVRACDRIFMLEGGRCVAAGTYRELMAHSAAFRDLAAVP